MKVNLDQNGNQEIGVAFHNRNHTRQLHVSHVEGLTEFRRLSQIPSILAVHLEGATQFRDEII